MSTAAPSILDSLSALADATRCRVLRLLESHELTVSELCSVLQLPQSTVSRHLKTLSDAGWVDVAPRRHEPYYSLALDAAGGPQAQHLGADAPTARRPSGGRAGRPTPRARSRAPQRDVPAVLRLVGGAVGPPARRAFRARFRLAGPRRAAAVQLGRRRPRLRHRRDCWRCSRTSVRRVDRRRRVGRNAGRRAHARCRGLANVELRRGSLEALPIDDATLDAATMMLVLHHLPAPGEAIVEAARVLKPGGRLLHRRHGAARARGIPPADGPRLARVSRTIRLRRWLQQAGTSIDRCRRRRRCRSAADATKEPGLFIATAEFEPITDRGVQAICTTAYDDRTRV